MSAFIPSPDYSILEQAPSDLGSVSQKLVATPRIATCEAKERSACRGSAMLNRDPSNRLAAARSRSDKTKLSLFAWLHASTNLSMYWIFVFRFLYTFRVSLTASASAISDSRRSSYHVASAQTNQQPGVHAAQHQSSRPAMYVLHSKLV